MGKGRPCTFQEAKQVDEQRSPCTQLYFMHDVNNSHRKHVEAQRSKDVRKCILMVIEVNSVLERAKQVAKRTAEGTIDSASINLFTGALSTA
jgi:hypothetical protein